jgi:hypothetical protein
MLAGRALKASAIDPPAEVMAGLVPAIHALPTPPSLAGMDIPPRPILRTAATMFARMAA